MGYAPENDFGWTRIEMLVALYHETIETLRLVVDSDPGSAERFRQRLKALSLIGAIESGVDTNYGEVSTNVLRLCEFVESALLSEDNAQLSSSIDVMQSLHDGFAEIQPEAVEMERTGVTSKIQLVSTLLVDV